MMSSLRFAPSFRRRNGALRLAALCLLAVNSAFASLSVLVPSGSQECFVVPSPTRGTISGNFDCLDDELDPSPVSVVLRRLAFGDGMNRRLSRVLWKSTPNVREEVFDIEDEEAWSSPPTASTMPRYELCFSNGHAKARRNNDGMDRLIGFNVRIHTPPRSLEEPGPDEEKALHLITSAASFQDYWETLQDHYEYLNTREEQHKRLLQRIYDRVMQYTLLEALVLISIALGQVWYLRKFLEKRAYL